MAIPVTLEEAKAQLRILDESQDAEVQDFINDAAAWCEQYTGHILVARDVTEQFRGFRAPTLRAWPIKPDAAPGVAYVDPMGAPIAVTGVQLDVRSRPARVLPVPGPFFPFPIADQLFTVTIRAGYEVGDTVPRNFRRAMLLLIGAYDADREGGEILQTSEATARRLLSSFRARTL